MVRKQNRLPARHPLQRSKPVAHGLALYMAAGCPYCLKISKILDKLYVRIPIVNPEKDHTLRRKLTVRGGRYQVPCLHIEKEGEKPVWMYESRDILRYLKMKFSRNNNS